MMSRINMRGFTMVELIVSMTFIAVLLLSIATLTLEMTGIFNKGITIRESNQAGQFISSEVQRALNQTYSNEVELGAVGLPVGALTPIGGRLCVGSTVYAWNYPDDDGKFPDTTSAINTVGSSTDVRFVKFAGVADTYCVEKPGGGWEKLPGSSKELLGSGNANIALHSFSITSSDVEGDATQKIYKVDMIIGTTEVGLLTEENRCKGSEKKEDEWCAINQFSFTARSGNKEEVK